MQRSCSSLRVSVKRASPALAEAIMPALDTRESVRVDLPWSTWAITDMLRMLCFRSMMARSCSIVNLTMVTAGREPRGSLQPHAERVATQAHNKVALGNRQNGGVQVCVQPCCGARTQRLACVTTGCGDPAIQSSQSCPKLAPKFRLHFESINQLHRACWSLGNCSCDACALVASLDLRLVQLKMRRFAGFSAL